MRVKHVIALCLLLAMYAGKAQTVLTTPPMVDKIWMGQQIMIDSGFHAFYNMKNESKLPSKFRFLLNWPGKEHILDSDSALLAWIGLNPEINLTALFKSNLMGVNRHSFIEQLPMAAAFPKKYRLIEYIEGFAGRLCRDYADITAYTWKNVSTDFVLLSDVNNNYNGHSMVSRIKPNDRWRAYDADPSTPYSQYNFTLEEAVNDSSLLFTLPLWKDTATPFAGVHGTLQQMASGKFFQQYLRSSSVVEYNAPQVPLFNTDNSLILCAGCEIRYNIISNVSVINEDVNTGVRNLLDEIKDTTSALCWNIYDADSLKIAVQTVTQNLLGQALPSVNPVVQQAFESGAVITAISNFDEYWDVPIGIDQYQVMEYVIPPHTDTLRAGINYRVPFWIEKTENAAGIIANRPAAEVGIGLIDSLNKVLSSGGTLSDSWNIDGNRLQTFTEGYLNPSTDTTRIWLHFNPEIIRLTAGTLYEILEGAPPVVTTAVSTATTGMQYVAPSGTMQVYPNPTTGTITVSGITPADMVTVYDAGGKMVLNQPATAGNATFNIKGNTPGIYIVRAGAQVAKIALVK